MKLALKQLHVARANLFNRLKVIGEDGMLTLVLNQLDAAIKHLEEIVNAPGFYEGHVWDGIQCVFVRPGREL